MYVCGCPRAAAGGTALTTACAVALLSATCLIFSDVVYESTHYPVFMHLWAIQLPGGTRASLRSDAAQAGRNLRATTKNDRKRQRRLNQAGWRGVLPMLSFSQRHCLTLMRTYRTRTCPTLFCALSRATTSEHVGAVHDRRRAGAGVFVLPLHR